MTLEELAEKWRIARERVQREKAEMREPTDECRYCLELRCDVKYDPILGYVCVECEREITEGEE